MTEPQAQRIIETISAHWFPVGDAAALWHSFLAPLDAEAVGLAVAYLAANTTRKPTIAEFKEVLAMQATQAVKARALPEYSSAPLTDEQRQANIDRVRKLHDDLGWSSTLDPT